VAHYKERRSAYGDARNLLGQSAVYLDEEIIMVAKRPYRSRLATGLLGALLSVTCAAPLRAAPLQLPPVVQPASSEHHVGKIIWLDLVTPNLAIAKQFYSGLFGWSFRDIPGRSGNYALAALDGRPMAGLFQRAAPAGEHRQSAWLGFIAVNDVDAAKQMTIAQGGRVLSEPRVYPGRGRQAVLADPQGAIFAVLASSSGDPPDMLASPGEWIWSSVIATDPGADAAFYQTVFGYDVFDAENNDGSEHLILATEEYARASVNGLPDNASHRHPHWLNFVRVVDAVQMAAKVSELGGRVLVEPRVDRHGGRVAVVADPSGAPFGLLEWPDTQSKEVTP
jgi:predicted enzyme related to lactoylglutathione lyase